MKGLFMCPLYLFYALTILHFVNANLLSYSRKYFDDDSSHRSHRFHRRRSIQHEDRFLGFRFTEEPSSTIVKDGRVQLNCKHAINSSSNSDVHNVRIEWRKDGTPLSSLRPSGRVLVLPNGSLLIENAGSADHGIYQCIVHIVDKNDFTWTYVSKRASVHFPSLSRFEVQPQDHDVYRGQAVAFSCVLDSQPPAVIQWYHNDRLIVDDADASITIFPLTSTLEIGNVQSRHEGKYKCVAKNADKSRISRDAKLSIRPENNVGNEFSEPSFALEPRGEVLDEGDSIVLECLANGWPKPDVRWLKGSQAISADGDRIRRLGTSSLLILKASPNDAGVYTCRASNTQDSADSSATIQVKVAPEITTNPKSEIAQETTDVEFSCEASGKPGAVVSWYKNGEAIIASEYFVIEANRLRILGLVRNDQGVYQCIADNDAGSVQASAQLIVDNADTFQLAASDGQPRVPSEPLGVRASVVGSRFVTLAWDPPVQRYGSLLAYHIFYKELGSTRERMINSTSTSFTVTPLQPNTVYMFRLVAENEAGIGKSTSQLSVTTTKEQAVPGKVRNLQATALSPETIEVTWEPPGGNGPTAVQYKLFYIRKDAGPNEKETQIVMKKTSYTLHGMDKYVEYVIRVEAEGSNGAGLSSEPVIVRTLSDLPSMPPADVRAEAASSTSILVQWLPLPNEERNGVITGYRIKYKTKLRGTKGNTLVVDGNDVSYTITALDPATQYMLRVAALNQNGSGPNSEWVHVETPLEDKDEGQVAGPPMSLKVQPSSDSIQLSWLPPRDEGVMVRGYLVGWGINIPDVEQVKVPSNLRYYTITGLKPSRDYVISLRAYNVMGNGFPIYETVRTTSIGVMPPSGSGGGGIFDSSSSTPPETPVGVRADAMSSSAIRITWIDPELDVPYSRQYAIRYSSNAESNGQPRFLNTSETEVLIEGLRPNTQYEFAVRVNAGRASSPWSMTAINRTLPAPPSSAPRDLTVVQPTNNDPHSLTLNWQPPKYGNGEIEEYLIYYSDRADLPDKDWVLDGVKGDRLSITLTNLLPRTTYFFKMQARNVKGYGPLSPVLQYVPGAPPPRLFQGAEASNETLSTSLILSNPLYAAIGVASIVVLVLSVIVTAWCVKSNNTKSVAAGGYVAGRKSTSDGKGPPDFWINHPHNQHVRASGNGTLTRSYHQSSSSLEGRQRTPQVVYTGSARHQPVAKIDFSDHGSSYGSSQALQAQTPPPPQLPNQGPPVAPPSQMSSADGYRTLRAAASSSNSSNPLKSFTQLAGAPPPLSPSQGERTAHVVRPVVVASPNPRLGKPAGVVIGQKSSHVPVGRATAQPRVNVNSIYAPYTSCALAEKTPLNHEKTTSSELIDAQQLHPSNSTEELNAQMENLDTMIDDLQALQHEFNTSA